MVRLDKYALVTGASSGIGWHISLQLAQRGYGLIAVSNQPEKLSELQVLVSTEYKEDCLTLNTDLAVVDAANTVFAFCREKEISPEILINNAGMLLLGEVISQDQNRLQQILNLHINTVTELAYLFAGAMKDRGGGYILNVASISAVMPFPVISIYGPSKAYVRAFTKALRTELAEYNIRVSCLIPGATNTPLNDSLGDKAKFLFNPSLMMQPGKVARKAIAGLFHNKGEIVPGFINKLTLVILPVIPGWVVRKLYQSAVGRKLK